MSEERYRLIFKGELQEGQHQAVVKNKLGELLKLSAERVDKLFEENLVVIKKSVDKPAAAKYQAAFKKCGARLRVALISEVQQQSPAAEVAVSEPVAEPVSESATELATESISGPSQTAAEPAANTGTFSLAPAGSNLQENTDGSQATAVDVVDIDTSHLDVALAGTDLLQNEFKQVDSSEAPDVSHISLSENDSLAVIEAAVMDALDIEDVDWQLAEPGADLLESYPEVIADFDIDLVDFDLAAVGSVLDQKAEPSPPSAPDTSHLTLKE